MIKPRPILLFILSCLIGNLAIFLEMVSSTSMEKNAFIWGFSLSRLIILAITALGLLLNLAFSTTLLLKWRWIETRLARLDRYLQDSHHANLFFAAGLFFLLLETAYLALLAAAPSIKLGSLSAFLDRGLLLVGCAAFITLCTLLGLFLQYKTQLLSRSHWNGLFNQFKKIPVSVWLLLPLIALAVLVMLSISPAFAGRIPKHDSGIFLYFGSRILKGDIPFRNLWDHKPPLIFYIDALGLLLFNHSVWGVWILEVLSLIFSILGLFVLLRKLASPSALWLALLGLVATMVMVLEGGNLTEEFGLPLQCLSLVLFFQFALKGKYVKRTLFLNGITLGMALMLKQTLIGVWAALFLLAFANLFTKTRWFRFKDFFCFAGGLCIVIAAWTAYFASQHALWEFWDVAYRYNFIYSDITWADRLDAVGIIFWVFFHRSWFLGLGFLSWVALLISRLVHFITHRSKTLPLLLVFALLDLPIEIALISLSGENYDHYFFTILPCMAILIAFGWTQLQRVKWFKLPPFQWAVYLLLALTLIVSPIKQVIDAYRQPIDQTTTATIEYIRKSTLETDYVLLWGSQTMINFVSGRDSPTRFVHQKGLFRSGYASPQISAEMLNDLSTKKPVLIIDSHLPSTPFLTMTANGQCIMPDTVLPQGIPEVFQYICNHYDLVGEVGGKDHWQVYKLR